MERFICTNCGVQYEESEKPPSECPICEDEKQWVPMDGQTWTTFAEMRSSGKFENYMKELEPGLTGISTRPTFAIGQRCLLVQTPQGNVLWDCISYLDDKTIKAINDLGGISAIAICHPHFYSTMVEWSHTFGNAPVYLHAADRQWVMRSDPVLNFFDTPSVEVVPGVTVVHCGGHFEGSTALHWAQGAEGRGVFMTGDTIQATPDRKSVSFLYSYPNLIPQPPKTVRQIVDSVMPYEFDRIHGVTWGRVIERGAKAAVQRSAERYIRMIQS